MDNLILLFLAIAAVCAFATGAIASSKGRSGLGWGWVGALFGPIGVLAALVAAPAVTRVEPVDAEARIPCPHCAEMIMPAARKCRFCGADLA